MAEQSLPQFHYLKPLQPDAELYLQNLLFLLETPPLMTMLPPVELPIIGFLTARSHPDHGYFGGLLLINTLGRPLEFHCTLPIQPSRAQAILYGSSLDGYLCGEQIARALLQKVKSRPSLVLTDCSAVLSVRNVVNIPTVYVDDVLTDSFTGKLTRPESHELSCLDLKIGDLTFGLLDLYASDADAIRSTWKQASLRIDYREPFGRISEALLEAHPAARAA